MADEANEAQDAPEGGGMMKKLMLVGVGVALLGAGVFAGMTFLGDKAPAEDEAVAEEAKPSSGPAIYQSLHPPLVVNFKDEIGEPHFMQITMEVMARDQNTINSVREHTPVIRNSLILLYSGALYEEITTREGKEQMLADGLAEINRVMEEQTGDADVEAVYFTALVIQ